MPITQNPEEYYQHYCLSQRRVERWVQETEKQLQLAAAQVALSKSQNEGQSRRTTSKESERHAHELPSPPLTPTPLPPTQVVGDARQRTSHRLPSVKPHREHDASRSRSRPSSGSKKIGSDGRRKRSESPASLTTYLPYGILPLLFAVTGTSVVSVVFALVILAGYIVHAIEDSKSNSSPRKHRKHP
ncbi:hypothetical protein BDN70DRAFT_995223 [Pholiota conissans]|uniref:Uncharacterized protein n=1 Tax=Pholiota conissans TaxID=109636 RepID=A0A9P5YWN2_9AGAR|nr:hypothetical protein BDN70DRAFT_995223 [Pholiota conissans]